MKNSTLTKWQLFNNYINPNIEFCKRITNKYLCTGDFEETMSLVLVYLYDNIKYYDPSKPLIPWLHICIKRYVNGLNKRNWKELSSTISINETKNTKSLLENPSEMYFETGDFDRLGSLFFSDSVYCSLKILKPIDRKIILMHYIDGYDFRTIAENIGLTLSNVKTRAFFAIIVMRYKITGKKPSKTPIYKYLEKSTALNAI